MHRNPEFFKGPDFQSKIEAAQEEHAKLVGENKSKNYFKEPSAHDIYYSFNPDGQRLFYPSSVPAEPGLGAPEPEDISDRIRRQLQGEAMLNLARELGAETFEESNDFAVEEGQDLCPYSGHEYDEQDESAVLQEHQRLLKAKEEKDALDQKKAKLEEYKRLKAEYEAANPPSPQPQNAEREGSAG